MPFHINQLINHFFRGVYLSTTLFPISTFPHLLSRPIILTYSSYFLSRHVVFITFVSTNTITLPLLPQPPAVVLFVPTPAI